MERFRNDSEYIVLLGKQKEKNELHWLKLLEWKRKGRGGVGGMKR